MSRRGNDSVMQYIRIEAAADLAPHQIPGALGMLYNAAPLRKRMLTTDEHSAPLAAAG
jgi:hypothetical protein